jgi:multiple sugar transport system ATP-binding protein
MASVTMEKLTKVYPNGHVGLADLDLEIDDGELLVLVGPSGCGKSTALRMVAGLEEITKGELFIGEEMVNDLPPKERDIAMVFQNYALYPHLTVARNIGFALKLAGVPRKEIDQRVREAARTLELEPWLNRRPGQLSGGQRQRVAMGRAIVREPAVFLMDEPLSNLDAKLRVQMRAEIAQLQRKLKTTTIYVTHDQVEAMTLGDRVAVLRDGHLKQIAAPEELYEFPDNLFVATFIGSPAMNLLQGTLEIDEGGGGVSLVLGSHRFPLPDSPAARRPSLHEAAGRPIVVGIRPEVLADPGVGDGSTWRNPAPLRGTIELREALGSEVVLHLQVDAEAAIAPDARISAALDEEAGQVLEQRARADGATVVAKIDARSRARTGDAIELMVDTERLHFFDPESGLAIRDRD